LLRKAAIFFKYIVLTLIALIQVYPFVWMLLFSLKDNNDIFGGNVMGFPRVLHWENYTFALGSGHTLQYFLNSVIVSGVSIALSLIISLMVAYAVSRMRWKYGKHLLAFFLLGIMIPGQAIILPVYITMHILKLYNTLLSLILVYAAICLPTSVFILSAYMQNLPKELEESSALDGAGIYKIFFKIIVPVIKPAIATVVIFSFLTVWNEFMFAYILISKESLMTITVGLFAMQGKYFTNWGPIGAALVIASFPTIAIYLAINKNIQSSLVIGTVKG
jgi:raffinose/stachyose/melibiose transport system permease protein